MSIKLLEIVYDERPGRLTSAGVAAKYGVTTGTVHNWVRAGVLPEPCSVLVGVPYVPVWDAATLPAPSDIERPKRGFPKGSKREHRRPAVPFSGVTVERRSA